MEFEKKLAGHTQSFAWLWKRIFKNQKLSVGLISIENTCMATKGEKLGEG